MPTRRIRLQLIVFVIITLIALTTLGWYYLRLPTLAGVGQYKVFVNLPTSGGLYASSNVTYRGATVGKVTDVEPVVGGIRATLSIDDGVKIPADSAANVHSVSAVGEQYIDLSSNSTAEHYLTDGQTVAKSTVPQPVGPLLDSVHAAVAALPKDKVAQLLDETSRGIGGQGPALQRLVDATQAIGGDLAANLQAIDDIIDNTGPVVDSQVNSGAAIRTWARNVRDLAAQARQEDPAVGDIVRDAAPVARQLNDLLAGVQTSLPQLVANLAIVADLLKRYHAGVEQGLVFLPQAGAVAQTVAAPFPDSAALDFRLSINSPPPCLTGFLPPSQWRSPADTSMIPAPPKSYCKIPQGFQGNVVRGARNYPCADVPGKRAATPQECRSNEPYTPMGTNPWYGETDQTLTCPAPGARCDQPVKPGYVIPAPSVNNGMNPIPAEQLPGPLPPSSDPLTPPGSGTVQCSGQQPNPCLYTPTGLPIPAAYDTASGTVVTPDGTTYAMTFEPPGDGWKLALDPSNTLGPR